MTNSKTIAGFLIIIEPSSIAEKIPFFIGQNIVGRSESKATLLVKDASVSQKHVRLLATPNKVTIIDLGSKNGTKINSVYNDIQKDKEIEIDESMMIYFAEVKCRIQIAKTEQETMKIDLTDKEAVKEKDRKKVQLMMRMFQDQEDIESKKQIAKNQFKNTKYQDAFDINQGFQGKQEQKQKKKKNQAKKKNTKNNNDSISLKETAADASISQTVNITKQTKQSEKNKSFPKEKIQQAINQQDNKNIKGKEKEKKNKKIEQTNNQTINYIQPTKNNQTEKQIANANKGKRKVVKQIANDKKNIEKEIKIQIKEVKNPSKSPQKNKNVSLSKREENISNRLIKISERKQQPSRRKSERLSNQREQKSKNNKEQIQKVKIVNNTIASSKLNKPPQKNKSKQKAQSVSKNVIASIKDKNPKNKLKKDSSKQKQSDIQTNINDELINSKKTINNRKKMVTQSLQKQIHYQVNKRNIGKRVMFSSFIPCLNRKYFAVIDDIKAEFDFLVMKEYKRTFKALLAICRGIPIVRYDWIIESQYYEKTLKYENYLFKNCPEIYTSIQKVKQGQKIFSGYEFFFFSDIFHLPLNQIQMLIQLTGGKYTNKPSKLNTKNKIPGSKNYIALFCKYDESRRAQYRDAIKAAKNYSLDQMYSIQLILDSCQKQRIDWSSNKVQELI